MTSLTRAPERHDMTAGQWYRWRGRVLVACPRCARIAALDHEVSAEGIVSPSLECPCGFHESGVRLDRWTP